MKDNRGQALIMTLVLLPALLVICGVLIRSGSLLLSHQHIVNLCNEMVLDSLTPQAKGLKELGAINGPAQDVIDRKREIEAAERMSEGFGGKISLETQRQLLLAQQSRFQATQLEIRVKTLAASKLAMSKRLPAFMNGRSQIVFNPAIPTLHISVKKPYLGEIGAPVEFDEDFAETQVVNATITMQSESFVAPWNSQDLHYGPQKLPDVTVKCRAVIKASTIEDKIWTITIDAPQDRLSSKLPSASPLL